MLVCLEEDLFVINVFLNRRLLQNLFRKQSGALERLADRAEWNILKILKLVIHTYTHFQGHHVLAPSLPSMTNSCLDGS